MFYSDFDQQKNFFYYKIRHNLETILKDLPINKIYDIFGN